MASGEEQVPNPKPVTKEQHWRDAIRQWQSSGQTIRGFCAAHHLSEHSFHAWRRTIARRDQLRSQVGDKADDADRADRPAFVPVRILAPALDATTTTSAAVGLELVLGSRRTIRVSPGFDDVTLRRLLALLEEPSC